MRVSTFRNVKFQKDYITNTMPTIRYISGGLLGDFIHQLSVIKELFLISGKKGDLYISDTVGEPFQLGVEATFNDIYSVIISQEYISSFKIYNNERIDVNLSEWRKYSVRNSWRYVFKMYDISWARTPFLQLPLISTEFQNTIFISTSPKRWPTRICFKSLIDKLRTYKEDIRFICSNYSNYIDFETKTGLSIPCITCDTFESLANNINQCAFLVSTLSMPLSVADALFKNRIALLHCYISYDAYLIAYYNDTKAVYGKLDSDISFNTNNNAIQYVDEISKIKFLDHI
jgi:hypothetical protein